MGSSEKLPSELVGEILCRVPTKSLARFRAVCKPWNAIWEDKSFLKSYFALARPHFILRTKYEIFSVDINLGLLDHDHVSPIELREIPINFPCPLNTTRFIHCDGFLLCDMGQKGFVVWNHWVRQSRWRIAPQKHGFRFCGVGYDSTRPETGYKMLALDIRFYGTHQLCPKVASYECKSDAWKFIEPPRQNWRVPRFGTIVSLAGNLYWIAYYLGSLEYFIRSFDFSKEMFSILCLPPAANEKGFRYTQVLSAFKGDRLSVLRQSSLTGKIVILVTSQKIGKNNGEAVVWINLMTVSIPNLPRLPKTCLGSQPSYFVDEIIRGCLCVIVITMDMLASTL